MQYSPQSEVWRFDEAIAHYAAAIRIPIAEVMQVGMLEKQGGVRRSEGIVNDMPIPAVNDQVVTHRNGMSLRPEADVDLP